MYLNPPTKTVFHFIDMLPSCDVFQGGSVTSHPEILIAQSDNRRNFWAILSNHRNDRLPRPMPPHSCDMMLKKLQLGSPGISSVESWWSRSLWVKKFSKIEKRCKLGGGTRGPFMQVYLLPWTWTNTASGREAGSFFFRFHLLVLLFNNSAIQTETLPAKLNGSVYQWGYPFSGFVSQSFLVQTFQRGIGFSGCGHASGWFHRSHQCLYRGGIPLDSIGCAPSAIRIRHNPHPRGSTLDGVHRCFSRTFPVPSRFFFVLPWLFP